MRASAILLILVALVCAVPAVTAQAPQTATPAFDVAGTDAAKVQSFLKSLQTAVAVDNRMKVASMFNYPVDVWADGRVVTIKGGGDLQANYGKVFDPSLKQTIASAKVEALSAKSDGVVLGNGRMVFAPVGDKLKVTRIAEPVQ